MPGGHHAQHVDPLVGICRPRARGLFFPADRVAADRQASGGSVVTLVLVNLGLGYAVFKSKKAATLIEGKPEILIHNGVVFEQTMTAEKISRHDLDAAVRESGCASVENVHLAVLETNGRISVVEKK
jgi:Protein of unknown function (DUF421)